MTFKKLSRIACVSLIAGVTVFAAGVSGCTIGTKRPEAKITIEFNDNSYELEYELHRNKYPQTVKHFIELADEGFYDNTIIHNYTTNDWYGGGYGYNAETYASSYAAVGSMTEYFEDNSLEGKYYNDLFLAGKLSASVYKDSQVENGNFVGKDALPTLIGEFSKNGHSVENGGLTSRFGALKMYYSSDKTYNNGQLSSEKIWMETEQDDSAFYVDYKYNSATSIFAMQIGSTSSLSGNEYCTFAVLKNDKDEEVLNDLKEAITKYIEENHSGESLKFYKDVEVTVDLYEQVADKGTETTFAATSLPIVIKTVEITKY
ncbi:MAG: hypothetical protein E7370_03545 [Clostridiales bacterium]|nr:hypothetical protein [Clostridiales bacterium]